MKPTEPAVRAARLICASDEDANTVAQIIDTSCHLPELKEALEKAKLSIALTLETITDGESVEPIPYLRSIESMRAALAAIEKVKI